VPVGDVLVGDSGGDIEHDDAALAVDVVSVTKTSKLLLSCGVPDIELNVAQVLKCVSDPHHSLSLNRPTVLNPKGWTSTPRVAMYFFSNSPVK
jgi:hypothetical protein